MAGKVRRDAYGKQRPLYASNLIGTSRLALPEQLVEIAFTAVLRKKSDKQALRP